ncbi:MAG: PspC domain-containing protein [Pseudonocardiaceae bacterium]
MSGATPSPPKRMGGFEDTVKDFWASRPRRPRRGRKIAGVAVAVGDRYGIDPVLVRVALVVATVIGGFGLLLYLLGWLFFPEEGDEVSGAEALLGRGHSRMSTGLTVVLCIALIPVTSGTLGGLWFHGGGLVGLALMGAGLYLLHRNRGRHNRPVTTGVAGGASASFHAEPATDDAQTTTATRQEHPDGGAPPAWDPLGAAPFAWDLPDPAPAAAPPAPRAPRRRTKAGRIALGLALVAAGAGVAMNVAGVGWFSPPHIVGLALAVLGLGLVAGAFAEGRHGLLVLAAPLSIAGLVLTAVPFHDLPDNLFGSISEAPGSARELKPEYETFAGSIELDLRQLPERGNYRTEISATMGSAEVIVPADADVEFTCSSSMGSVNCLGQERSGMETEPLTGTSIGGDAGGPQITLDVSSRMGSVEVRRG